MSASTPSPQSSSLSDDFPRTPQPSRPTSSLLYAHASPQAVFSSPEICSEPQTSSAAQIIGSDVAFDEESECDDVPVDQFLPTTPAVQTIGRTGFSRTTIFLKVVLMHLYAARCMLTLTQNCLQMAHVIPVSAPANFLWFLERVFGDKPDTLNRHSSRNIWLLDASMHYSIDKGLIKLVPAKNIVEKILDFTRLIYEVRIRRLEHEHNVKIIELPGRDLKVFYPDEHDWDAVGNDEIRKERKSYLDSLIEAKTKIHRTTVFPPGLYPYHVIGIRCHDQYTFPRQIVDLNSPPPSRPTTGDDQILFEIPLKVPDEMLQKPQVDTFGRAKTSPLLRGIKDKKGEFEIIDPLEYDESRVFLLGQDPCLVLANIGEFLHVIQKQHEEDFEISELIADNVYRKHLRLTLDTYLEWKSDDRRIQALKRTLEERAKAQAFGDRSRNPAQSTSTHSHNLRPRKKKNKGIARAAKGLMAIASTRTGSDSRSTLEINPGIQGPSEGEHSSPSVRASSMRQKSRRGGSQRGGRNTVRRGGTSSQGGHA
ncbi:hypothetical protein E1B28_012082 [Marasmius oreades]|uniref:Uncharacterized protein n=1 Tax=Marasmius oreades TaxID=181124 RepID=A0A9P7RS21_9AGAR|nr:uncharacterized protein E1B28_012082 [Marasmius oreades]KAG7088048.1 hypothetical protein E1B28_012082 [Marasmius oreades]